MTRYAPPDTQTKPYLLPLTVSYVPALAFLALTVFASLYANIPLHLFARDPLATVGAHPLTGVQSNLGVLAWCAAAAICFFSGEAVRRTQDNPTMSSFLLWSGVITSVLLLDDFFMVHEDLVARYMRLDEKPVLMLYVAALAWHLFRFRSTILRSEYPLLFVALGFFALSLCVDFFQTRWESPWRIFFEDGFKLLGIAGWSGYLIRTSFQALAAPDRTRQAEGTMANPQTR